jgi:hypothetical protein
MASPSRLRMPHAASVTGAGRREQRLLWYDIAADRTVTIGSDVVNAMSHNGILWCATGAQGAYSLSTLDLRTHTMSRAWTDVFDWLARAPNAGQVHRTSPAQRCGYATVSAVSSTTNDVCNELSSTPRNFAVML